LDFNFLRSIFVNVSPFITKNDLSLIDLAAFLIAPPVPNGFFSIEYSMLIPKLFFDLRKFFI